jgi:hypothetical protein
MVEGTRDIGERINTGAASHFPNAVVIGHAPFLLPILQSAQVDVALSALRRCG